VSHFLFRLDDIDSLFEAMEASPTSITDVIIDDNRRRHVTILLSERGTWATEGRVECPFFSKFVFSKKSKKYIKIFVS
jgi:hypothetical protein